MGRGTSNIELEVKDEGREFRFFLGGGRNGAGIFVGSNSDSELSEELSA